MTAKKLSPAQQELLDAIRKGVRVHCINGTREGWYYFRADSMDRCTAQAKGLEARGLVERYDEDWRGYKLRAKDPT
jgi:hypothetical protein